MAEKHVLSDDGTVYLLSFISGGNEYEFVSLRSYQRIERELAGALHGRQTGPSSGWHTGMSLRDYLAGQAVAGLTAAVNDQGEWTGHDPETTARQAYAIADAMLKARMV